MGSVVGLHTAPHHAQFAFTAAFSESHSQTLVVFLMLASDCKHSQLTLAPCLVKPLCQLHFNTWTAYEWRTSHTSPHLAADVPALSAYRAGRGSIPASNLETRELNGCRCLGDHSASLNRLFGHVTGEHTTVRLPWSPFNVSSCHTRR